MWNERFDDRDKFFARRLCLQTEKCDMKWHEREKALSEKFDKGTEEIKSQDIEILRLQVWSSVMTSNFFLTSDIERDFGPARTADQTR